MPGPPPAIEYANGAASVRGEGGPCWCLEDSATTLRQNAGRRSGRVMPTRRVRPGVRAGPCRAGRTRCGTTGPVLIGHRRVWDAASSTATSRTRSARSSRRLDPAPTGSGRGPADRASTTPARGWRTHPAYADGPSSSTSRPTGRRPRDAAASTTCWRRSRRVRGSASTSSRAWRTPPATADRTTAALLAPVARRASRPAAVADLVRPGALVLVRRAGPRRAAGASPTPASTRAARLPGPALQVGSLHRRDRLRAPAAAAPAAGRDRCCARRPRLHPSVAPGAARPAGRLAEAGADAPRRRHWSGTVQQLRPECRCGVVRAPGACRCARCRPRGRPRRTA